MRLGRIKQLVRRLADLSHKFKNYEKAHLEPSNGGLTPS